MMNTTSSSIWRRFSDYEISISTDRTKYIRPVPNSTPAFYDPLSKLEKLASAVIAASVALKEDETNESVVLDFVRSFGLPGFALELQNDYVFPFGGTPTSVDDISLSRRGSEYICVFSPDYAEKYSDICNWLKTIDFSADFANSISKDDACINLKNMTECCISSLVSAGKIRPCKYCGKYYYTEDPESETCSKVCEFQYSLSDSVSSSKKRYIGHLIGGG